MILGSAATLAVAIVLALPGDAVASPQLEWFGISGLGTTPGVNYAPEEPDHPVDLEDVELRIELGEGWYCNAISNLPVGQRYTVLRTTAGLSGEYANVPAGSELVSYREGHDCQPWRGPSFRIEYLEEGPVQSVVATVDEGGSAIPVSALTVAPVTVAPQTNQTFEFRAALTMSGGSLAPGPIGTVGSGGGAGRSAACSPETLSVLPPVLEATCRLPYNVEPGTEPGQQPYGAAFTGNAGEIASSWDAGWVWYVRGETTTALNGAATAASSSTLIATVSPRYAGPIVPEGSVRFTSDGKPLEGCEAVTLHRSGSAAAAACTTTKSLGAAEAVYEGDPAFGGSESPPVKLGGEQPAPALGGPILPAVTVLASATVAPGAAVLHTSSVRAPAAHRHAAHACVTRRARHRHAKHRSTACRRQRHRAHRLGRR
jgi:hypothetical protein